MAVLMESMVSLQRAVEALQSNKQEPAPHAPTPSPSPPVDPSPASLPDCTLQNPWRFCGLYVMTEGCLVFPDGPVPISDLEFWPHLSKYPSCWVRLNKEAEKKDDVVVKETILFDNKKAQRLLVQEVRKAGFSSDEEVAAHDRKKKTFLAPNLECLGFVKKGCDAVDKAMADGKPFPSLEECRPLSLILPCSQDSFADVHKTFSVGKLPQDIASKQFHETLP